MGMKTGRPRGRPKGASVRFLRQSQHYMTSSRSTASPVKSDFETVFRRLRRSDGGAARRHRLVGRALPAPEPALHDFIEVYGVPGEKRFRDGVPTLAPSRPLDCLSTAT